MPFNSCSKGHAFLLLDQVVAFCVVAPLVVMYWRGTWQLWDIYVYPNDRSTSGWVCFVVGNVGLATLALLKEHISRLKTTQRCSLRWILGYHGYIYVAGFISVSHWRGIWLVLDEYTGMTIASNAATLVIALSLLWLLRASKNCWAPPVVCVMDTDSQGVFEFNTRFDTKHRDVENYILDTLLTTFVIHNLVVFFWRGSWGLLDLLLYTDDLATSAYASLVVSAVLFFGIITPAQLILLHLQTALRRKPFILAVLVDDVINTLANLSAVCHWRGVWYVFNVHVLVDHPEASNWLTHCVGELGLALLLCSASYVVKSYHPDGGRSAPERGQVGLLSNEYVRYWLTPAPDVQQGSSAEQETPAEPQQNNNVVDDSNDVDSKGEWV